jgi:hypothetical protein
MAWGQWCNGLVECKTDDLTNEGKLEQKILEDWSTVEASK